MARIPQGYTLHEDPDRVVIATTRSHNAKTGGMVQVWILAKAQDPLQTIQRGWDSVICGNCRHAGKFGSRTCYVRIDTAPLGVWKAWKRGRYPHLARAQYADVFYGRTVRWGAYGDPAYIPLEVLRWVSFWTSRWTGYTHQWQSCDPRYRELLMASCDTEAERLRARAQGWRTFRVRPAGAPHMAGEITCPASDEAGHRTQCARCGLCNGSRGPRDARKDITILVHGAAAAKFQSSQLIQIVINGKGESVCTSN